ncbi:MAG: phage holin family protein [Oscillospiraceae bacterium]|nr:phage holin family protein [Oscillospiraceae bacterium]
MDYIKYIKSELLILVPVLYLIGLGLKKSKLPDKWIPLTLGITGISLSAIWVFTTSPVITAQEVAAALFTALTQGILAAGASVYASQLHIQAHKDE